MKLSVSSDPAGASVFVGDERTARCQTPCDVEEPRGDASATLIVKLSGYADVKRTFALSADQHVDLELRKTGSRHITRTKVQPKTTSPRPIGDNTLNPFEN